LNDDVARLFASATADIKAPTKPYMHETVWSTTRIQLSKAAGMQGAGCLQLILTCHLHVLVSV
jgi:hypothetical protein